MRSVSCMFLNWSGSKWDFREPKAMDCVAMVTVCTFCRRNAGWRVIFVIHPSGSATCFSVRESYRWKIVGNEHYTVIIWCHNSANVKTKWWQKCLPDASFSASLYLFIIPVFTFKIICMAKKNENFFLRGSVKAQRGSRDFGLLSLNIGVRWGVVNITPRPLYRPQEWDKVPPKLYARLI